MVNFKETQKRIKEGIDVILPDYKGKIEGGGNIFHRRKISKNTIIVNHNMLNYQMNFPITCGFAVSNDVINYHLCKIYKLPQGTKTGFNIATHFNINDAQEWYIIKNEIDIDSWLSFLKINLPKKLTEIQQFDELEYQENYLNSALLNASDPKINIIENSLSLIYAKIVNKPYFNEIADKIKIALIKNNAGASYKEQFDNTINYLTDKTSEDLKQLNNN